MTEDDFSCPRTTLTRDLIDISHSWKAGKQPHEIEGEGECCERKKKLLEDGKDGGRGEGRGKLDGV